MSPGGGVQKSFFRNIPIDEGVTRVAASPNRLNFVLFFFHFIFICDTFLIKIFYISDARLLMHVEINVNQSINQLQSPDKAYVRIL